MPPIGHTMSGSSARTERTGPMTAGTVELKIGDEARDVALDDLLVDHVGLVDAGLRSRVGGVLDLHRQRRAAVAGGAGVDQSGERRGRRRHRGGGRRHRGGGRASASPPCDVAAAAGATRTGPGPRRAPPIACEYVDRGPSPTSPATAAMRSSRGGWVSNRLLNFEPRLLLVGLERLLDPHLRRRLRRVVHDRVVVAQFFESRDQPWWIRW